LFAISTRNPFSIWRVVPKGYSKASCHDFKAARSKASEVMAAEARGRQRYGGLEIVGKYVETNLLAKTLSVFRSYLKSSLHKKKGWCVDWLQQAYD
jgi:hypothetical protein